MGAHPPSVHAMMGIADDDGDGRTWPRALCREAFRVANAASYSYPTALQ
jgi:hypothetical protein